MWAGSLLNNHLRSKWKSNKACFSLYRFGLVWFGGLVSTELSQQAQSELPHNCCWILSTCPPLQESTTVAIIVRLANILRQNNEAMRNTMHCIATFSGNFNSLLIVMFVCLIVAFISLRVALSCTELHWSCCCDLEQVLWPFGMGWVKFQKNALLYLQSAWIIAHHNVKSSLRSRYINLVKLQAILAGLDFTLSIQDKNLPTEINF